MKSVWIILVVAACSKDESSKPVFVDPWPYRPVVTFTNMLTEDNVDPYAIRFTIQLPDGMFHAPEPDPTSVQHYGIWRASGLHDETAPGADVRLAPYGPKTLDALVSAAPLGYELVQKQTFPDGAIAITTRNPHAWYVEHVHFDRAGHVVQCSAWRHDDDHELGASTRRMLEKICESLALEPGS